MSYGGGLGPAGELRPRVIRGNRLRRPWWRRAIIRLFDLLRGVG